MEGGNFNGVGKEDVVTREACSNLRTTVEGAMGVDEKRTLRNNDCESSGIPPQERNYREERGRDLN